MNDTCRIVDVDGTTVRVRGGKPMTPADVDALAEIVRAVRAVRAMPRVANGCACGRTDEHGPHE